MSEQAIRRRPALEGFETEEGALPKPPMAISTARRLRLMRCLAAINAGQTPEEIHGFLADGFPDWVKEALERAGETQELSDHVDLLLRVVFED